MYKTGFQIGPRMYYRQIEHGATVLATGATHNVPRAYSLGKHAAVTTQIELDSLIEDEPERVKYWGQLAMIQCVGSRTPITQTVRASVARAPSKMPCGCSI
jgi:heterodisulfide reductase subunit A